VQGLNSVAGNTTGVQLNGNALTVEQAAGTTSSFGGNITDTGAGSLNKTGGGTLALSGNNSIDSGNNSTGGMTISGGTLSQTGGSLSVGGNVTVNSGATLSVANVQAIFEGPVVINGAYSSDPATSTFVNLTVGSTGYLSGGSGDVFDITGNFYNTSTDSSDWNTKAAELEFSTGSSTSHTLELNAANEGANFAGYQDNFAWALLSITGNGLDLEAASPGDALYVYGIIGANISGDFITNIMGNGDDIYYDPNDSANAYLGGLDYSLENGGELIATVPEPTTILIFGAGLAGLFASRRRKSQPKAKEIEA